MKRKEGNKWRRTETRDGEEGRQGIEFKFKVCNILQVEGREREARRIVSVKSGIK